jgi:hypothetical protein
LSIIIVKNFAVEISIHFRGIRAQEITRDLSPEGRGLAIKTGEVLERRKNYFPATENTEVTES